MRQAPMLTLKMYSMTYAHELGWALSSEPTIEAAIRKLPFLEYPALILYTILHICHTNAKVVQRHDTWNFYRCMCDFNDEQPVTSPTVEAHGQLRAQLEQCKQRTLHQMRKTTPTETFQKPPTSHLVRRHQAQTQRTSITCATTTSNPTSRTATGHRTGVHPTIWYVSCT